MGTEAMLAGAERDAGRRASDTQASEPPERERGEQGRGQGEEGAIRWRETKRDSAEPWGSRGLSGGSAGGRR